MSADACIRGLIGLRVQHASQENEERLDAAAL
jgi:hypothetical protein